VIAWADAVVIASPSHCHLDDLWACSEADKPCLVEKPLGLVGQGTKARQILERTKVPVAIGFNLRFHPDVIKMKAEIEAVAPYYASFTCCQFTDNKDALTDGCLNHWACHEIDLALHLIGPLKVIDKHHDNFRVDLGLQHWESGCHVHVHSDMRAQGWIRQALVVNDDASYCLDLQADPVTNEHYKAELQMFLDSVLIGKFLNPLASGYDGLAVLELCERIDGHGRYQLIRDKKERA